MPPLLFLLLPIVTAQKLLVLVVDGFPGFAYYKYSNAGPFQILEREGAWSDLLYPEFPTQSFPNLYTLATGRIPAEHGIVGEMMFDEDFNEYFMGGRHENDYQAKWWNRSEPLWVTATKNGVSTALLHWPGCQVPLGPSPSLCVPLEPLNPRSGLSLDNLPQLLSAIDEHDLVFAYHRAVWEEAKLRGPSDLMHNRSHAVTTLTHIITALLNRSAATHDINIVVLSQRGVTEVPRQNRRFLEDFLDMSLVRMTVGAGAVKQIIPQPGKEHQIFTRLRREAPIPNVKIYYTTERMSDLPQWYGYKRGPRIPPLVLVAQPGYVILSKEMSKQVPIPSEEDEYGWYPAMSGYNNNYPEMLGLFLAHGPSIRQGYRKGPAHLVDMQPLFCHLLSISCPQGEGNLSSIADVLRQPTSAASLIQPASLLPLLLLSRL